MDLIIGATPPPFKVPRLDAYGEGAVLLLEKLSTAVNQIDSSSGALGNATNGVVEKMVPLIVAAPVPRRVREKWLERLLETIQEDDPPYIEALGEHCGALFADPSDGAGECSRRSVPE